MTDLNRRNFILGALATVLARVPTLAPVAAPVVSRVVGLAGYMRVLIGGTLVKIPFYD